MEPENIEWPHIMFITGTGTDVGKSYATGWLARELHNNGIDVTTQKMVQTGNTDMSEDIATHRKIMGIELTEEDNKHLTAPEIFTYPASPHLAAAIDGRELNLSKIEVALKKLADNHEHVIIEGAGGLMVPLTKEYLTADYLHDRQIPTILVVSGQLGSINHALMSLVTISSYEIPLFAVIYNPWFDKDKTIAHETRKYLHQYVSQHYPSILWFEMPENL